jgi:hypothetical protein
MDTTNEQELMELWYRMTDAERREFYNKLLIAVKLPQPFRSWYLKANLLRSQLRWFFWYMTGI